MIFRKTFVAALFGALFLCPQFAAAQSSPNWPYGYVPTPAQWNQWFALKQDLLGYTPINKAGDTMLGPLITAPSTATAAGFNLQIGTSPTAPNNGDLWTTTTGFWLRLSNASINLLGGASVNYNPSHEGLEDLLPIQTFTTGSHSFVSGDLFYETRRANSGSAMTDTFPCATTVGVTNGAVIQLNNVDASANDTVSACAGTTINGGSSVVIGHGRSTKWVYDPASTNWRPTMNSLTALLSANNLSDVASASAALSNLGGLPLAGGTMTGPLILPASTTGAAPLNIPQGTAPTSPNNGDCWTTSAGLYCHINGSTVGPYVASGGGTVSTTGSPTSGQAAQFSGSTTITGVAYSGSGSPLAQTSPAITTPMITGVSNGGNAASGIVGEYISSSITSGSAVSLTTNTPANITSVSLTAGDWQCSGNAGVSPAGSTIVNSIVGWISATSATVPTNPNGGGEFVYSGTSSTGSLQLFAISALRISISSTTTIYLSIQSSFSTSTNGGFGFIGCRRMR